MKKESQFQSELIKEIKTRIPGSYVIKVDPTFIQGFPDLLILHPKGKWAALEVKREIKSSHRPNQDYHVANLSQMGFASFICPETKGEVLNAMELALES